MSLIPQLRETLVLVSAGEAEVGLPDVNSGEYLTTARVTDYTDMVGRRALPLDGDPGGEVEYLVPDPESQLEILESEPVAPPY